jgi:hypothetical protein
MPDKLFFPTVHIHDGKMQVRAGFDHVLYAQPNPRGLVEPLRWEESEGPATAKVATVKCGVWSTPKVTFIGGRWWVS